MIEKKEEGCSMQIGIKGCHVETWQYQNIHLFYPLQKAHITGDIFKKRGGMFTALPNYGKAVEVEGVMLPQHGTFRDTNSYSFFENSSKVKGKYALEKNDAYHDVSVVQEIKLLEKECGFEQMTTISLKAGAKKAVPLNIGLHPYFAVNARPGKEPFIVSIPTIVEPVTMKSLFPNKESYSLLVPLPPGVNFLSVMTNGRGEGNQPIIIDMKFSDVFKNVVIWTDNPGKYICVEPIMSDWHSFPEDAYKLHPGKNLLLYASFALVNKTAEFYNK